MKFMISSISMIRFRFALWGAIISTLLLTMLSCAQLSGVPAPTEIFKVAWTKNIDPAYNSGNLPVNLSSPLIAKGLLFLGTPDKKMIAYSLDSGRVVWSKKDNGSYHAAPILHQQALIYGTTEGRVYSRHYLTGKLNYSVDLGESIDSSGVAAGGMLLFQLRNHKLVSLDIVTGKIFWAYKRSVPFLTTLQRVAKPLVDGNRIFVGFADGYLVAFSRMDGVVLWQSKLATGSKFIDVDATPLLVGKHLVVGLQSGGPLTMVDAATGKIFRRVEVGVTRQAIMLGDHLLMGTTAGELVKLDSNYNILARVKLDRSAISSVKKWKGGVVVGTVGGNLFYLNSSNLQVIDRRFLGHTLSAVFGDMMVSEGRLAVLSSRNRLYLFY
ncbi:MAG: PQQ-binding-like beta-propeller repeat protein [Bdellovibrionales bacterium]|nr:PQQ-binding-like beta-propeller repeat protein [Bdellovibrionales bacterium]MBT3526749.1 PQQ-binding-like beta-propeller repeat protein [Bdellovibrionales bacterium]